MANDITLSATQRQTLISLKRTSDLSDRTQVRLATGREINGVTDGAEDFFAARTLQRRAGILAQRNEQVDQGISTIQAALEGIDALDEFLSQLRGLTRQARSQTAEERVETTRSYDSVVAQFQNLLEDSSYQGLNLLNNANANLTVRFSEDTDSELDIDGVNILATTGAVGAAGSIFAGRAFVNNSSGGVRGIAGTANGLNTGVGLSSGFSVLSNGTNLQSLNTLDARLSDAQDRLESRANVLANNVAILQTRLEYGENLISNHVSGADKIVNADLNEEAANLTATGTRYQIGVQSLGVAGQRVQSLLQLIR
ncbi:MAG: hypothetical protein K0U45_10190 [Alphaproteobacteria bacterium]|nr:hypothetical protein [Alphaproteobacteria bacterium]